MKRLDVCIDRVNIINIIRSKSLHLTSKALTQIYTVLIRSVMEYSAILLPAINKSDFKSLQMYETHLQ